MTSEQLEIVSEYNLPVILASVGFDFRCNRHIFTLCKYFEVVLRAKIRFFFNLFAPRSQLAVLPRRLLAWPFHRS